MIDFDKLEKEESEILDIVDAEEILIAIQNYFGTASWAEFVKWFYDNEL